MKPDTELGQNTIPAKSLADLKAELVIERVFRIAHTQEEFQKSIDRIKHLEKRISEMQEYDHPPAP